MRRRLPAIGEGHTQGVYPATTDITPDWNPDATNRMSEQYSSMHTDYGPLYMEQGIHPTDDKDSARQIETTVVPDWPNPSIGGEPGPDNQLGWTKGIQYRRWHTTPFKGEHLTLSGNKAHDTRGPVGRRAFLNRLAQNVPYQFVETSPTPQEVAQAFTWAPSRFADDWANQSLNSDTDYE